MADAVLSDGTESLLSKDTASDNTSDNAQCSVTDGCSPTLNNCDHAHQLKPAATPTNTECVKNETASVGVIRRENKSATAAPKYQRRSYDDRQLPPVVCIDREIPWYHDSEAREPTTSMANNNDHLSAVSENNNVMLSPSSSIRSLSSSSSATPVRKKIHQAYVPTSAVDQQRRFSKKSSQTSRSAKMTSSVVIINEGFTKEHTNTLANSEKNFEDSVGQRGTVKVRSPANEKAELNYMDNMSNNNKCSKNNDLDQNTASGADSASAATDQRKFAGIKKRVNRNNCSDTSGEYSA